MVYHTKDTVGTTRSTRSTPRSASPADTLDQSLPGFRAAEGGPSGTAKALNFASPGTAPKSKRKAAEGAAISLGSSSQKRKYTSRVNTQQISYFHRAPLRKLKKQVK
jgi:hypothetical protein